MAKFELILPKMGESVAEATITSWLISEGDQIESEDGILEIATDKVDSEVPSPVGGVLIKQLFNSGDVVKIGAVVAIIETDELESSVDDFKVEQSEIVDNIPMPVEITEHRSVVLTDNKNAKSETNRFYSPLVKSIAKKENISTEELEQIIGTGKNNRLTKNDLLAYLNAKKTSQSNLQKFKSEDNKTILNTAEKIIIDTEIKPSNNAAKSISGEDEIIEMDRMRKLIAANMLKSKQISPHVTSVVEVDVTNIVLWRNKVKSEFELKEKSKLTFTPLFIEAIAKALRDFPMVNISIDGDKIIKKKAINIGMAVALPSGNLIVPVVKNADQLNLIGLTKRVNELSSKARVNKLSYEDIEGGTFTLTNIGTFGNAIGTPIINQPEAAIMAVGMIQKKPAVIETPQGDTIGIKHMMFLSMSYDHRVIDGMLGGSFLRRVADYLEKFDFNRQIW